MSYATTSRLTTSSLQTDEAQKGAEAIRFPLWESNRRPKEVWVRLKAA